MIPIYGSVKNNTFVCEKSNTYTYKKNIYKICYDGNIYSSAIMKQELLSKGYYFETNLEEEVILKAFIEYGIDVYNKFAGHFSFAIWCENKKEIIFMRDYYSLKTFYYKLNDNGEIEFSNKLSTLLYQNISMIKSEQFINTYLKDFDLEDGEIVKNINEIPIIMIYSNKAINKIKEINCTEYGYIFDEVAQIVLANIDSICAIELEEKNNEIDIVMEYILETLKKDKILIKGKYSQKKLNYFLENIELPFFNIAEYKLNFMLKKVKNICLIDLNKENIKRFYNINFFENMFNTKLIFPNFSRKIVLKIEEIYNEPVWQKADISDYRDEEFILNKFQKMLQQTKIPICELKIDDVDYYMMIYLIRLNNWVEKYNIKII